MPNSNNSYDVVIIGGGGAGIMAAITAGRLSARTLLCEKMPKLGKKVRISGNGRCNLTNDKIDSSCYNSEAKNVVESVFEQFSRTDILQFFKELGLRLYSDKEGRVFPITNQSTSVLDALELELDRLSVDIACDHEVMSLKKKGELFLIEFKSGSVTAKKVILSAGGKSYPVSGTDGSAYALATAFGHSIVEPVPATVPLLVKDPWCNHLTGQKITASVRYQVDEEIGPALTGDLLFTDYGLSGLTILDSSDELSIAIHRGLSKNTFVIIDLVPFMHEDELKKEISYRLRKKFPTDKLLMGILPPKFSYVLADVLKTRDPNAICSYVKNKKFAVQGAKGWNEAEFTAGGVHHSEINPKTLESKKCPGLYLAGEILNINGKRGGYNLAWAWASGFVTGTATAKK